KVKVGKIDFTGNTVISDSALRGSMRGLRPVGVPHSVILTNLWSKTYDKPKLDQDLEFVRGAYQDKGYFNVQVNNPTLKTRNTGGGFGIPLFYPNKPGRAVDITIPVVENSKYVLGTMTFNKSTLFRDANGALRPLFQMQEGETFNISKIRKGLED